jgi:lipoprotein-anchoring transpeptidase ErfK/SrfK
MNILHRQRPRKSPCAGIAFGFAASVAAFAAIGAGSAAAQYQDRDCVFVFCRDRPAYDRPDHDRRPEYDYDRRPGYDYDRRPAYDQPYPYDRPGPYGRPGYPQGPQWQREPEWQSRPAWQEPAPEPYSNPAYRRSVPAWQSGGQEQEYAYYARLYADAGNEPYPLPDFRLSDVDPVYLRRSVDFQTDEVPGTIIIDPRRHFLYFIEGGGHAIRYGVGVGRSGFGWSGVATVHNKQAWPNWYPPREMMERQPEIWAKMSQLQSGVGMPGGPGNPLGARALYLWHGNKDTLYRIHGTVEPWTIGRNVSSGCIRMVNQDVIDLFERAPVGAKVVVLSPRESAALQ